MAYQWVSGLGDKKIVNVLEHAKWFLNTPYLWGGRSIFGIDCSGFVQVLAQMAHLKMPRDAYQQALMGQRRMWQNKQVGDLAFFENDSGKINHVGIIFTPNTIIHASGKVRIDEFTPKGIVHSQTKELTHKLTDIRTWTI
jgi:cell wall-associated NlpC family hydrolase